MILWLVELGVTNPSRRGADAAVSGTPCEGLIPRGRGVDLVDRGGAGIRWYGLDKFDAGDVSLLCCGVDMNSKT